MAKLTVTVPDALVPALVVAARAVLAGQQIDTSAMTASQVGERYIAEMLKRLYQSHKSGLAAATAEQAANVERDKAKTDTEGIS